VVVVAGVVAAVVVRSMDDLCWSYIETTNGTGVRRHPL
jgi:hypothetical protein